MKTTFPDSWPEFFTATIQEWKYLLSDDRFKDIIIESLQWLVINEKVKISAYVIMSNHIHLIWQAKNGNSLTRIQISFKKYTAHRFLHLLNNSEKENDYRVYAYDKKHYFWKRNSLGIELFTQRVYEQKLEYIHNNPVNAGLCNYPEDYPYSSARFYETGIDKFGFLEL